MPQRLLITGRPGVGKTTLVQRVVAGLSRPLRGFITQEVREGGRRVGFQVVTFSGRKVWLAHVARSQGPRVGRYRVNLAGFEEVVLPELDLQDAPPETLVVVDEIGPMELLSVPFQKALMALMDGPWDVLATMALKPHPIIRALKARQDVEVVVLTPQNRDALVPQLRARLGRAPS